MLATIQIKTLGPHKYGCLMAPLPSVLAADLLAWTRANVPEQHLGPGGIETTPHVTVKYGFKDAGPDHDARLRQVVRDFGAFPITLGPASLFTGGDDGDVLKLDVESDRLRELNKLVSFLFACEDKYPDYQPHVTLAYLDPKVSAPYASAGVPFTGRQVKFDRLLYSTAEGAEQFLPLGWLGSKRLEMQTKGWVTMGGKPCGDGGGQHCGGTAVELGGDGEIKKGPKGTVGKKPAELPKKDSKPKATAPAPAPKKEKPAQPAPAKKDGGGEVSGAVHDLLKTMNGTPEQINAGGCWTFAYKLVNKVGRGELRGNGIHGWAEIDGKHYDAEAPEGQGVAPSASADRDGVEAAVAALVVVLAVRDHGQVGAVHGEGGVGIEGQDRRRHGSDRDGAVLQRAVEGEHVDADLGVGDAGAPGRPRCRWPRP